MADKTYAAGVSEHVRWMATARYSISAVNRRQRVLDRLAEYAGPVLVTDLSSAVIATWRDRRHQEVADSTLVMEASHVQGFLGWAHERELLAVALTALPRSIARILNTEPREEGRRWLTDEQVGAIVREPGDRGMVLAILAGTGLRKGEASALLAGWWDAPERVLRIPEYGSGRTKRHRRDLPVGDVVASMLDLFSLTLSDEDPLLLGPAGGRLPGQAGVWLAPHGCSPHDLRRWYSQTLLRAKCPHEIRHGMLGHAPGRRDGAYERPEVSDMREWADKVDSALEGLLSGTPCQVAV